MGWFVMARLRSRVWPWTVWAFDQLGRAISAITSDWSCCCTSGPWTRESFSKATDTYAIHTLALFFSRLLLHTYIIDAVTQRMRSLPTTMRPALAG